MSIQKNELALCLMIIDLLMICSTTNTKKYNKIRFGRGGVYGYNDQKSSSNCNYKITYFHKTKQKVKTNKQEGEQDCVTHVWEHNPHLTQKPHYTTLDLRHKAKKCQFPVRFKIVELCKLWIMTPTRFLKKSSLICNQYSNKPQLPE